MLPLLRFGCQLIIIIPENPVILISSFTVSFAPMIFISVPRTFYLLKPGIAEQGTVLLLLFRGISLTANIPSGWGFLNRF